MAGEDCRQLVEFYRACRDGEYQVEPLILTHLKIPAVEVLVETETKTDQVMASVERTLVRDAELLARLEDS